MREMYKKYYDPTKSTAFGGVNRFLEGIKNKKKRKRFEDFLKSQRTYTIHRPKKVNFKTRAVVVFKPGVQFQADLVDLNSIKQYNDGNRFILNVIDCFSRKAYARAQKTKSASETTKSFADILEKGKVSPRLLQTDRDPCFYSREFKKMLKKYNIHLFSTHTPVKCGIVERFNRTLLTKMFRYLTHKGNYRWVDILQTLIKTYNSTKHRTIGMAPISVNMGNSEQVFLKIHNKKPPSQSGKRFEIGDYVRLSRLKNTFEKGYTQVWSDEVFRVHKIKKGHPDQYSIIDLHGSEIVGSVYHDELQKINYQGDNKEIFPIDRVLEEKGQKVKVRWKGYGPQFDSWIRKAELKKIR